MKKVKVKIFKDEWYPVFGFEDFTAADAKWGHKPVELEKSFIERYEKNLEEFNAIQETLQGLNEAP